jgi:hypothetical protein
MHKINHLWRPIYTHRWETFFFCNSVRGAGNEGQIAVGTSVCTHKYIYRYRYEIHKWIRLPLSHDYDDDRFRTLNLVKEKVVKSLIFF